MENKNDDLVFEMNDDFYVINTMASEFLPAILIISVYIFGYQLDGVFFKTILIPIAIYALISSSIKIFFKNKDKKIYFFKDKLTTVNKNIRISINNIQKIYRVPSIFIFISHSLNGIGINIFKGKILQILLLPITLFLSLVLYITKFIYYKNYKIPSALVVIGKNDKEVITIQIPPNDTDAQANLNNYFKVYLNTDINKLETNYFILKKG
jgi:hypothetical protein